MSFGVIHSQPHDGWQESEDYHVLGPRKLCPSAVDASGLRIALDLGLMSKQAPATCAVGCATGQRAARCSRFLSQRAYEGVASLPCASAGSAGVCDNRHEVRCEQEPRRNRSASYPAHMVVRHPRRKRCAFALPQDTHHPPPALRAVHPPLTPVLQIS